MIDTYLQLHLHKEDFTDEDVLSLASASNQPMIAMPAFYM